MTSVRFGALLAAVLACVQMASAADLPVRVKEVREPTTVQRRPPDHRPETPGPDAMERLFRQFIEWQKRR
jgi:hypothetical protein